MTRDALVVNGGGTCGWGGTHRKSAYSSMARFHVTQWMRARSNLSFVSASLGSLGVCRTINSQDSVMREASDAMADMGCLTCEGEGRGASAFERWRAEGALQGEATSGKGGACAHAGPRRAV